MRGTVKAVKVGKGYGFLTTGAADYFFHVRAVVGGLDVFEMLQPQDVVEFEEDRASTRGPRARVVRVIDADR